MELTINVDEGTDPEATSSLYRWLAADRAVHDNAQLGWSPASEAGSLGSLDIIDIALSNAITLGCLVASVANWRASRPRSPIVRIERDDIAVEVMGGSIEDIEKVVQALLPPLPEGGEDA